MKRLFTFGCSFTSYYWPTWADIIGKEFDYYENWGLCGGGNQYIFNSLIECYAKNKLSDTDTVMIMWTNIARDDRYIKDQWVCPGNILSTDLYDNKYIKEIFCERGFLIRDIAFIAASIELLKKWNVKFEFLSMMPINNVNQYSFGKANNVDDVLVLYKEYISKIKPSVYEVLFQSNWYSRSTNFLKKENIDRAYTNNRHDDFFTRLKFTKDVARPDLHPSPEEHLEFIEKILPQFIISQQTRDWIKNYNLGDNFEKHFPNRL